MRKLNLVLYLAITLLLSACGNSSSNSNTATIYKGEYCYRGEILNGKKNGYGVLSIKDSVVYSGMWKNDKRNGYGTTTDTLGRQITALWQNDTIVSGTKTDSTGIYHGELNDKMIAEGHGTWTGNDGSFYTGQWKADKRNGFGCGVTTKGKVKAGDWRNDVYRGERMLHTSDRIYGIDVSKYQHERGKKRYGIDWASARITGLGNHGGGKSDYKITFAYIKSTEGTTVRNKYFLSDYRQARSHGIKVGAYHFFSARSAAGQQARFFLKNSKIQKGDLPPVLDLEPDSKQISQMGGVDGMFRKVRTWLSIVRRATGVKPVLYVGQGFVNKYLPLAPDIKESYPIWIARYGQYRPDIKLAFWQLTPYGRVKGIRGEVDINVFNGYKAQFAEFMEKEGVK